MWNQSFDDYKKMYSTEALQFFIEEKMAICPASGKMLNRIYRDLLYFVGEAENLVSSNKTIIEGQPFMDEVNHEGPNIHFGVRGGRWHQYVMDLLCMEDCEVSVEYV